MAPTGVSEFERFFREAANLDIDKDDLRRYNDFVNRKIYDLLVIGQAKAKANGRDVMKTGTCPSPRGPRRPSTISGTWTRGRSCGPSSSN